MTDLVGVALPGPTTHGACQTPPGGSYRPVRWLGGPSSSGLALPDASPSPSTMYAPRGVCQTDTHLVVADTGQTGGGLGAELIGPLTAAIDGARTG